MSSFPRRPRLLAAVLALVLAVPALAPAASKRKVAAMGDAAPGGGIFAGPSFTGSPSAAGNGWLAYRAAVSGGNTAEQIVVENGVTGARDAVASLGQQISPDIGKIKQFLGRPAVNGHGDVAFAATITQPDTAPPATAITPAGIFVRRNGVLSVVALAGTTHAPATTTALGQLDITSPVNIVDNDVSATDIPERTPAIDDAGTVSFVASTISDGGVPGAGVFSAVGGALAVVAGEGQKWNGHTISQVGPPATSPSGRLAFRTILDGDAADSIDAIFTVDAGVLTQVIDADHAVQADANYQDFVFWQLDDAVAVADDGSVLMVVAYSALLTDGVEFVLLPGGSTTPFVVASPGLVVKNGGTTLGRISGFTLGATFGSRLAPPSLTADGQTVVVLATLNDGTLQVVARARKQDGWALEPLVQIGGATPDPTPIGGTYLEAATAAAVDDDEAVVFAARVAGGTSSEVLVYKPLGGLGTAEKVGDVVAGSSDGYFAGPPFFPPQLNDAGTVVFRSYVARGPGLGIFRARADDGTLEAVVRVGDPSSLDGQQLFIDFPGDPSLDASGNVAFAAAVRGKGRAYFVVAPDGSMRTAVAPRAAFSDPDRADGHVEVPSPNLVLRDDGSVVFRAAVSYTSASQGGVVRREALLAADAAGTVRVLAEQGGDTPTGSTFSRFRDPSAVGAQIAFRAQMADGTTGVFLFTEPDTLLPVVTQSQQLGTGAFVEDLTGRVAVDGAGHVACLAKLTGADPSGDQALLVGTAGGVAPLGVAGDAGAIGGVYKSFGRPTLAPNGHLAYRVSFQPSTGQVTGIYLAAGGTPAPYLQVGESAGAEVKGKITGINQNLALSANDDVAFIATVSGGNAPSAILLASRAKLRAARVRVRIAKPSKKLVVTPHDRLQFRLTLAPGTTSAGIVPGAAPITITLTDAQRIVWSTQLKNGLKGHGRQWVAAAKSARASNLQRLALVGAKGGAVKVAAASTGTDLTNFGSTEFRLPLSVRLEVGHDSATAVLSCKTRGRVTSCR